jgi:hypothetical protein
MEYHCVINCGTICTTYYLLLQMVTQIVVKNAFVATTVNCSENTRLKKLLLKSTPPALTPRNILQNNLMSSAIHFTLNVKLAPKNGGYQAEF